MLSSVNRVRRFLRLAPGIRFSLAWHGLGALFGFMIAVLLLVFDPFDLDRGIAERGRDAFYEVAAFAYPEERSTPEMVVMLDDAYLQTSASAWPPQYSVHANAIETIASRQPRAIMLDFLFLDQRDDPSIGFLVETLRRVSDTVPIYLAAPPKSVLGRHARAEIENLVAETKNIRFVSVGVGRDLGAGLSYPLISEDRELRPTAVALYEDLCRVPGECRIDKADAEMDIWWAVPRRDKFNCRGEMAKTCARLPAGPIERAFSVATGVLGAMLPEDWRPLNPAPIPYAPTIGLSDLFNSNVSELVGQRLRGAVVFYGSNLAFAVDTEMTPAQGRIASVHAHAMAYDNLHVLDGNYIKARAPFGFDGKLHLALLIFLLALAAFVVRIVVSIKRPSLMARPHRREKFFGSLDGAVFLTGAAMIAIAEFSFLHIGPYAWAPVLAAAAAGDFLSSRNLTGRALLLLLGRKRSELHKAVASAPPP